MKKIGTEETIFTLMTYLEPEKYCCHSIHENGLIGTFADNIVNNKIKLTHTPKLSFKTCKTNLYILTFNYTFDHCLLKIDPNDLNVNLNLGILL